MVFLAGFGSRMLYSKTSYKKVKCMLLFQTSYKKVECMLLFQTSYKKIECMLEVSKYS